ncbi:MAG: hypothetical protein ACK41U_06715 [Paracoccus sp. (in: a-proteobacteria)]|uniref:hypothetical protein n=1 Tax=Paracoccus sp. TaxID=267 RepID=UPI00391C134D
MAEAFPVAAATSVVASGVYLCGYRYLGGYFSFYDLSSIGGDYGFQTVLAHALPSILSTLNNSWILLILAVLAAALITIYTRTISVPLFAVASFIFYAVWDAPRQGFLTAQEDYPFLKPANVISGPAKIELDKFLSKNTGTTLHHLISTTNDVYLISKWSGSKRRWIYHFPKNSGHVIRVYQDTHPERNSY